MLNEQEQWYVLILSYTNVDLLDIKNFFPKLQEEGIL